MEDEGVHDDLFGDFDAGLIRVWERTERDGNGEMRILHYWAEWNDEQDPKVAGSYWVSIQEGTGMDALKGAREAIRRQRLQEE